MKDDSYIKGKNLKEIANGSDSVSSEFEQLLDVSCIYREQAKCKKSLKD